MQKPAIKGKIKYIRFCWAKFIYRIFNITRGNTMLVYFASKGLSSSDKEIKIDSHLFIDDGIFPNNAVLKLVIYTQAFAANPNVSPELIEEIFSGNNWKNSWRNGLYTMHHYHSSAHEVLGIYSGWVEVQFGGPKGTIIRARAGDVIVIPAGVSHKNVEQSSDFQVIGAYPKGQMWDMNYGKEGERPQTERTIQNVPLPEKDPVFGDLGLLFQIWTPL